jgi:hypothetical protein
MYAIKVDFQYGCSLDLNSKLFHEPSNQTWTVIVGIGEGVVVEDINVIKGAIGVGLQWEGQPMNNFTHII